MANKYNNIGILFVCLGNICRSPLAEGVFRAVVSERGLDEKFQIDSCGTGSWHIGEPPHVESQKIARKNGIDISMQRARQLKKKDQEHFDWIVAMDSSNKRDIESLCPKARELICLREYDAAADTLDVPDPYYGGPEGFVEVFNILERSCESLLDELEARLA